MGIEITNDQLQEVAEVSGVLDIDNFITSNHYIKCVSSIYPILKIYHAVTL